MVDPYHYYRTQEIQGIKYLIAGGEDHKTGHENNTEQCFNRLESHVRSIFDVGEVTYKWSSQYYEPADGLPYIGHLPGHPDNRYVATGFGGNGLTYGTLSAIVLKDLITTGTSPYEKLFDPNRIKPVAEFTNLVSATADVVKNLVTGRIFKEKLETIADLAHGEGKVVKYEGHTVGLYKDENGKLYAVNPDCPHMHCSVAWNGAEQSWDCPCHGSRFSAEGKVLTAPTVENLEIVKLTEEEEEHVLK
jgi:Rieske Fe-S protein